MRTKAKPPCAMALQGEPESKMENNPVNLGDRDQRRLEGIRIIDLGKVVTARSLAFALTLIGVPAGAVEAKGVIKEKLDSLVAAD